MNALEGECLCLGEISINVNKLLAVLLLPVYLFIRFFLYCTLLLLVYFLISFYAAVVVACLFLYSLFYADVVAIFLLIRWSCKQAHYTYFWSFCLSFLKHYFHFRNSTYSRFFFLRNFSWHLITHRVFTRNLLRGNRRRNTFRILFWRITWASNPSFLSNKPTH